MQRLDGTYRGRRGRWAVGGVSEADCVLQSTASSASGDAFHQFIHSAVFSKAESQARVTLKVPAGVAAGRHVIPIDIKYGDHDLPQFTEAVIVG